MKNKNLRMSSSMLMPRDIYRLSSKTGHMMCNYHGKKYAVGFLFKHHAIKIQQTVTESSYLQTFADDKTRITNLLNTRIEKLIPNGNTTKLSLSSLEIAEFLTFPFCNNIGLAIVYDIKDETDNEFILETQIIHSETSSDLYKQNLENVWKNET